MQPVIESPCVRNCCLNEADICLGCFRSLTEITQWSIANNEVKREILKFAAHRRDEYRQKLQSR